MQFAEIESYAKMGRMLSDAERKRAWNAVDHARATRAALRRSTRRGDTVRTNALKQVRRELRMAMKPLRRELGRTQFEPESEYREQLLTLSSEVQRERRKIWKMLQPPQKAEQRLIHRIRFEL